MDFVQVIKTAIENDLEAQEAISIARLNASGSIWIIGGFLFRTIAAHLYGTIKQITDIDFIVEKINKNLIIPLGWSKTVTHYGQPRLNHQSGKQIDFVLLREVNSIVRRGLEPTIENYLTGVPLTIQSLAYNIDTHELVGAAGLRALQEKFVGINNIEQLHTHATHREQTPEEYIALKAKSLGFSYNLEMTP